MITENYSTYSAIYLVYLPVISNTVVRNR